MPWGFIVLALCSLVVFHRARGANRNPFGWVLILWATAFVGSAVGAIAGAVLNSAGAREIAIPISASCGILVAVVVVAWAAGRA